MKAYVMGTDYENPQYMFLGKNKKKSYGLKKT